MQNINISETKNSPKIIIDFEKNNIVIVGKSYPENAYNFYEPILENVKNLCSNLNDEILKVDLDISYLNSSSLKVFFDFFDILVDTKNQDKNIEVSWYYNEENDIAEETGEDFAEDFSELEIKLIPNNYI